MMINLKELKDNFNLIATFNLSEPKEFVGELEGGKEVLDRISLVLTQTFDAIGALPFRQLIVKAKDKKVVVIYYRNKFFGLVADKDENVENILKYIYEKGSVLKTRAKPKEEVERAIIEKEEEPEKAEEKLEEKIKEPETAEKKEVKKEVLKEKAEEKVEEKVEKVSEKIVKEEAKPEKVEPVEVKEKIEEPEEIEKVSVKKEILSTKVLEYIEEIAGNYLGDFSLDIVSNVIEDSGIDKNNPTKDQVLGIAQSLKDAASLIIGPSKAKKLNQDILKKIEEV
jgi:hypothetical protein